MSKHILVVVSNRLPIYVQRQAGKLVFLGSSGGLATAMSSLEESKVIWVGWPGIASDDLTNEEKKQIADELKKRHCYPVHLTKKQVEEYYEGYANNTIWPLFHYFQAYAHHDRKHWQTYKEVNQQFCNVLGKLIRDDEATFWVHDYHLMLLPNLLRKKFQRSAIGFFLHTPFPSYEIFRLLPERKELLEGILGADLVGFHIFDYARHFLSSCLRLLGHSNTHGVLQADDRVIKVDAFPIGIDYEKFVHTCKSVETSEAIQAFNETYRDEKIILSIDRLDYTKGLPERLEAFRLLLEEHPEYLGKIRLIMVAVPSRVKVDTYMDLRDSIEQAVSRINGTYATTEWSPISYQFQNLPFHEIVALYARADVMLVTPLRDGMNLVAKEYVASKDKQPGVLILSEMTGAVEELPESLSINPNDTQAVSKALVAALEMPKSEQLRRLERMQYRLKENTVDVWNKVFVSDLLGIKKMYTQRKTNTLNAEKRAEITKAYKNAKSRLIIFDYDGTLQSFKRTPSAEESKPSAGLLRKLRKLGNDEGTTLCVVSGRRKDDLESWFKDLPIYLVAEHGAWIKLGDTWTHSSYDFEPIREQVRPVMSRYVSRTPGSFIEEKDYAIVWHYRTVPTELSFVRAGNLRQELEVLLEESDANVHRGSKIIEVKPRSVNKGEAVRLIMDEDDYDFVLCAGDDYTDEDMFNFLPSSTYTIKVGGGQTTANLSAPTVDKILALLGELAKAAG